MMTALSSVRTPSTVQYCCVLRQSSLTPSPKQLPTCYKPVNQSGHRQSVQLVPSNQLNPCTDTETVLIRFRMDIQRHIPYEDPPKLQFSP